MCVSSFRCAAHRVALKAHVFYQSELQHIQSRCNAVLVIDTKKPLRSLHLLAYASSMGRTQRCAFAILADDLSHLQEMNVPILTPFRTLWQAFSISCLKNKKLADVVSQFFVFLITGLFCEERLDKI